MNLKKTESDSFFSEFFSIIWDFNFDKFFLKYELFFNPLIDFGKMEMILTKS